MKVPLDRLVLMFEQKRLSFTSEQDEKKTRELLNAHIKALKDLQVPKG